MSSPPAGSEPPQGAVRIGRLGRTHGLTGAMRLNLDDALAPTDLPPITDLHLLGHGPMRVRTLHTHGRGALVAFQGVRSRERAQALVNAEVYLPREELGDELVQRLHAGPQPGAAVYVDGRPYGSVVEVQRGPQTLLLVRSASGDRLIPGSASYVALGPDRVDLTDPPPGLLDDDAAAEG